MKPLDNLQPHRCVHCLQDALEEVVKISTVKSLKKIIAVSLDVKFYTFNSLWLEGPSFKVH